jgi:hypothetical protein
MGGHRRGGKSGFKRSCRGEAQRRGWNRRIAQSRKTGARKAKKPACAGFVVSGQISTIPIEAHISQFLAKVKD